MFFPIPQARIRIVAWNGPVPGLKSSCGGGNTVGSAFTCPYCVLANSGTSLFSQPGSTLDVGWNCGAAAVTVPFQPLKKYCSTPLAPGVNSCTPPWVPCVVPLHSGLVAGVLESVSFLPVLFISQHACTAVTTLSHPAADGDADVNTDAPADAQSTALVTNCAPFAFKFASAPSEKPIAARRDGAEVPSASADPCSTTHTT